MKKTKIEWCDSTWNPVTGCYHNCDYCYARKIAERFSTKGKGNIFVGKASDIEGETHVFENPVISRENRKKSPYPFGFEPTFHKYKLNEPYHLKKPQSTFVCSMADLFGDWVPAEWIQRILEVCDDCRQHDFLFLTKNAKRYGQIDLYGLSTENLWFGVSITRKEEMNKFYRIPRIMQSFVSMEPLLEDLEPEKHNALFKEADCIIIGAETGSRKGKVIPKKEWIEKIVAQADKYEKPVFMENNLIPIVGEENIWRETPWKVGAK